MLADTTVTFQWVSNGAAVQTYLLYVGSSVGAGNLYSSGPIDPSTLSRTVTGLPGNGQIIHVRLYYQAHEVWSFNDYQYTAAL